MESSVAHLSADRDPTYKIIDLSPTTKELSPDATEIVAFLQIQGSDPASAQSSHLPGIAFQWRPVESISQDQKNQLDDDQPG